jgi:asparagine synthase (glutamine-hydrolysing)
MCGINGFLIKNSTKTENTVKIKKMNDMLSHRGPDDEGFVAQDHYALGMRRLSIIDLQTGHQPIFNEDKTKVIVFNGEIYNYKVLRSELLNKGHKFRTTTDTEVILHAYEEYGTECFSLLSGMFAIAIYDIVNEKLVMVRDRSGEKPLYYSVRDNMIIFSSELKSILKMGLVDKQIDRVALNQYFQLGYIPTPRSIIKSISKLSAGHWLESSRGTINIKSYWQIKYENKNQIYDYEECKSLLRKNLFESVAECLVSDVPIGTFLSGGIDSGIITGIAKRISDKPIEAFTLGHKNSEYDESELAKKIAKFNNINHNIFYLNYNDVVDEISKLIKNLDEPFADTSLIPTYFISKYAKQKVKTILTGDAGDELFGGYNKYLINYYSKQYNKIPKVIRKYLIENIITFFPDVTARIRKYKKVINNAEGNTLEQYVNLICMGLSPNEITNLISEDYLCDNSLDFIKEYYDSCNSSDLDKAFYTDYKVVLEGSMLTKVDRASMFASLETRVPMLNKDLIKLASRIPDKYKINKNQTKIILKDTFKDLLPPEVLTAEKKGFEVPIDQWFRNELKEELLSELSCENIEKQGILNPGKIDQLIMDHFEYRSNNARILWAIYVFQKWYKNYFFEGNDR